MRASRLTGHKIDNLSGIRTALLFFLPVFFVAIVLARDHTGRILPSQCLVVDCSRQLGFDSDGRSSAVPEM